MSLSFSTGDIITIPSHKMESNSSDQNLESKMPQLSQLLIEPEMISRKFKEEDQEELDLIDLKEKIRLRKLPKLRLKLKLNKIF